MSHDAILSGTARRILEARYLLRDGEGHVVEAPEDLFHRVASAIGAAGRGADDEDHTDEYRAMLSALDFLPNSPTLMNAGTRQSQLLTHAK